MKYYKKEMAKNAINYAIYAINRQTKSIMNKKFTFSKKAQLLQRLYILETQRNVDMLNELYDHINSLEGSK